MLDKEQEQIEGCTISQQASLDTLVVLFSHCGNERSLLGSCDVSNSFHSRQHKPCSSTTAHCAQIAELKS